MDIYHKQYYLKNSDRIKKYVTSWNLRNKEKVKSYREKRKEKFRIYYKEWYAKNGRNRANNYQDCIKEWVAENPHKVVAMRKARWAIKTNKIKKQDKCSKCNMNKKTVAHHEDYTKPLDIIWVCHSCHKKIHIEKNNKVIDNIY